MNVCLRESYLKVTAVPTIQASECDPDTGGGGALIYTNTQVCDSLSAKRLQTVRIHFWPQRSTLAGGSGGKPGSLMRETKTNVWSPQKLQLLTGLQLSVRWADGWMDGWSGMKGNVPRGFRGVRKERWTVEKWAQTDWNWNIFRHEQRKEMNAVGIFWNYSVRWFHYIFLNDR